MRATASAGAATSSATTRAAGARSATTRGSRSWTRSRTKTAALSAPRSPPSDAEYLRRRLSAALNLVKVRIFRAKQKLQEILSDLRGA